MRKQMRAFDTYTHVNELKKAGFNEEQASVIIKSLVDSRETDISHLSTKEQLENVKVALENQVENVKAELKNDMTLIREQMKFFVTKEELKDVQITLIKWMVGLMIFFTGIILAGFQLLK